MMEKQISKKKLERLAIQGGGFHSGGAHDGEGNTSKNTLTLAKLRKLLEDDVKNLGRMATVAVSGTVFGAGGGPLKPITKMLITTSPARVGRNSKSAKSPSTSSMGASAEDTGLMNEICDKELTLIMDRTKLFPNFVPGSSSSCTSSAATAVSTTKPAHVSTNHSHASKSASIDSDAVVITGDVFIPAEGRMYDVVAMADNGGDILLAVR